MAASLLIDLYTKLEIFMGQIFHGFNGFDLSSKIHTWKIGFKIIPRGDNIISKRVSSLIIYSQRLERDS